MNIYARHSRVETDSWFHACGSHHDQIINQYQGKVVPLPPRISRLRLIQAAHLTLLRLVCPRPFIIMQLFYSYDNDGYSETDRTGAAQDYHLPILRNCPRPPPFPWWCVYTRPIVTTCAYIRRRFCRQSSVVDFIPSVLACKDPLSSRRSV